jgi:hypothetical protein
MFLSFLFLNSFLDSLFDFSIDWFQGGFENRSKTKKKGQRIYCCDTDEFISVRTQYYLPKKFILHFPFLTFFVLIFVFSSLVLFQ